MKNGRSFRLMSTVCHVFTSFIMYHVGIRHHYTFSLYQSCRNPQSMLSCRVPHILSTGLNPSTFIPLYKTCLAATYSANLAIKTFFSLPTTCK